MKLVRLIGLVLRTFLKSKALRPRRGKKTNLGCDEAAKPPRHTPNPVFKKSVGWYSRGDSRRASIKI